MRTVLVLLVTLASTAGAQQRPECGPRDGPCWDAVYRADSIQRDSASRAFTAKLIADRRAVLSRAARQLGCASVQPSDTLWAPVIGQTLCQVVKRIGVPDQQTTVSLSYGDVMYWYYVGTAGVHLVMFRDGRVVGVVW
jgi:hypothetical protein